MSEEEGFSPSQKSQTGQEHPSASLHKLANRKPLLQPVPPRRPPFYLLLSPVSPLPYHPAAGTGLPRPVGCFLPHSTHRSACHVGPHADWCSEWFDDTEGGNGPWSLFPPGSYKKCPSPATSRLVLLVYGPDGGGCDEESTRAASGLQSGLPSFLSFPTPLGIFPLSTLFLSPACFFLFGCDLVCLPCRRLTPLLHTLTDSYIVWILRVNHVVFFPLFSPLLSPPCAIAAASPTLGRWWPLSLPPGARVTSLSGRSHDNAQRTWT
ncbi:uncharacterized protein BO87DRAFT_396801 [Aspergillus neoniger CBS 115656]|uniref:Uncharacterized protein n=1 Tax=Aspergillus neoniger (strain CBS 115656) TaxID=1448310 RepID=A0A318YJA2_ASPNB|nr:hypothetical protein BO87DRAFT_396801 [Aspergillus neoniger CBS 115656]PYH34535.1 hypothetical protein BO87DRAFT_396801 [Aspergillus neoniger CBS 115656]